MATDTISFGNPEAEGVKLAETLNPSYVRNFQIAMEAVSPGSGATVAANIGALLRGEIPLDMQKQLIQSSAELNLTQGRYGEAANFSTMRTLGKASAELQQTGLSNLKAMMPELPDIAALIQNARTYDLEKARTQLSESQFGRQLAEREAEFGATNALDKLKLALQEKAQEFSETATTQGIALDQYKFDTGMAWDKTVSSWNREFEKWKIGEEVKLAQGVTAASERASSQKLSILQSQLGTRSGSTPSVIPAVSSAFGIANWPTSTDGTSFSGLAEEPEPYKVAVGGIPSAWPSNYAK